MMETMELGPVPAEEKCAQLGSEDYETRGPIECQVYRRQLVRLYKSEHHVDKLPEGCTLKVSSHSHDFGTYHEVSVRFDINNEAAVDAAFWFEANLPGEWDLESRRELEELIPSPNSIRDPYVAVSGVGNEVGDGMQE